MEDQQGRNISGGRPSLQPAGLGRNPDFMRLWIGQTISEFGSWLGALALLAILVLEATPVQMGVLETLKAIPALLIGLFAGVYVDRRQRRPILLGADFGRGILLGLVVVLAFSGLLQMFLLYVVAFLVGSLTVLFNLAYQAYVPRLVRREELVEANSRLGATASLAEIASPGLGGLLVQVISAPLTLLLDAISYLISAIFVGTIRSPEPAVNRSQKRQPLWPEMTTGLRLVLAHPLLRATAGASAMRNFFGGFFAALYSLYVLRELGLSPVTLGILIGSGGLGAFLGALITSRFTRRFGWGNSLLISSFISGILAFLIPLAGGSRWLAISILMISQLIGDLFLAIYFIDELSLRQSITPDPLLGRVNASFEFLVGGVGTIGILAGGLVGEMLGLRPATIVAASGISLSVLWLLFSPIRGLKDPAVWVLTADIDH
jgi:predicted MFS family arabinose efflux permease